MKNKRIFEILSIIPSILIIIIFIIYVYKINEIKETNLIHIDDCVYSDSSKDTTERYKNKYLYYDKDTNIVYMYYKKSITPYLSENGIPCKYDVLRDHIVEVVDGSEYD